LDLCNGIVKEGCIPGLEVKSGMEVKSRTHTQPFYSSLDFVRDNPGELVPEGTFRHILDFLLQNEDNTGRHTPTIQMDCHPSRLIGAPISAIPIIFTPDALLGTTLPIYHGLEQALNMLACTEGNKMLICFLVC